MKTPHLLPGLLALLLAAAALFAGRSYALHVEDEAIHALAPQVFFPGMLRNPPDEAPPILQQRTQGTAMQAAAVRQADLLPLYGGSEILTPNYFHASDQFQHYPEGFTVFPVPKLDMTCLPIAQKMAALGRDVQGKKVAISLSPISFYNRDMVIPASYANNFSLLHANALAFSTDIRLDVRHRAARRMLTYPNTVAKDPLLRFALRNLAEGSTVGYGLYYLAMPLGKLQTMALRLKDHWAACTAIRRQGPLAQPTRKSEVLDWKVLEERSVPVSQQRGAGNPYGFASDYWQQHKDELSRPKIPPAEMRGDFLRLVRASREWDDLDILLRALKDLGAEPLLLSAPIMGKYYDEIGIKAEDRHLYYNLLEQKARLYGVRLRSFKEHEEETTFVTDQWGHLHSTGWINYDRALADFFKGTLR